MNSQIFQKKSPTKSNASLFHRTIGASPALLWLSAMLLIAAVILFPERPAWGEDFDIQIGPNEIQGYAYETELNEVLEALADEVGYTFYLDNEMIHTRISFNIPDAIPPENAIGKIVHPFSHAIIYTTAPNRQVLKIEQVRIYYENPSILAPPPSPEAPAEPALQDRGQNESRLLATVVSYDE